MEVTGQIFLAALLKKHCRNLIKTAGEGFFLEEQHAAFIRREYESRRFTHLYVDCASVYESIPQRIAEIQKNVMRHFYTRQRTVGVVIPFLLDKAQQHQVLMVLRFERYQGEFRQCLDVYYADEQVRGLLYDQMNLWFCTKADHNKISVITYYPYSSVVKSASHHTAALLAMVSALTLESSLQDPSRKKYRKTPQRYYSPNYADILATLEGSHGYLCGKDRLALAGYYAILHDGRYYGEALFSLLNTCMAEWKVNPSPPHDHIKVRFINMLNNLLLTSPDLRHDPEAISLLYDCCEYLDPHAAKRHGLMCVCVIVTVSIIIAAGLGLTGLLGDPSMTLMSIQSLHLTLTHTLFAISVLTVTASACTMTWLWKASPYREPPVSSKLTDLVKKLDGAGYNHH